MQGRDGGETTFMVTVAAPSADVGDSSTTVSDRCVATELAIAAARSGSVDTAVTLMITVLSGDRR